MNKQEKVAKSIDEIKFYLKDKLAKINFHAIPNIFNSNLILVKLVWIGYLLISGGVCVFVTVNTITNYFNYEVVTKIDVQNVAKLAFPVIGVCNLNPFWREYSSGIAEKTVPAFLNETILERIIKNGYKNHSFNDIYLTDTIKDCSFGLKFCDLSQDFEIYYDINYGYCYRFNSGRLMNGTAVEQKSIYKTDLISGLSLVLFAGSASENFDPYASDNGLVIFINNDSRSDSTKNEGIQIAAGFSTRIALNQYVIEKQPIPFSDCTDDLTRIDSHDSIFYQKLIMLNSNYRYTDCINMCYQKYLGEKCGCQTTYYNFVFYDSMRLCSLDANTTEIDYICSYLMLLEFTESIENIQNCNCPKECDSTDFSLTISFAEFPTRSQTYFYFNESNNQNYEYMKKSYARVDIFYKDLKVTKITESPKMTLSDLISNIGGTFSLFLGLSFASLIELIEILISLIDILMKKRVKINILFEPSNSKPQK